MSACGYCGIEREEGVVHTAENCATALVRARDQLKEEMKRLEARKIGVEAACDLYKEEVGNLKSFIRKRVPCACVFDVLSVKLKCDRCVILHDEALNHESGKQ